MTVSWYNSAMEILDRDLEDGFMTEMEYYEATKDLDTELDQYMQEQQEMRAEAYYYDD